MKTSKSLTKLVNTVFDRIYNNVIIEKNSDYSKIFQALKKYPRGGTDHIASLIVPYVEDVVEKMEKMDKELMFSDTDITYAANTIAEMMGDKVRGAYSHMQKESHCGCSKESKETADEEEFEMQLKNKKKLTESIIKKFRFGSK